MIRCPGLALIAATLLAASDVGAQARRSSSTGRTVAIREELAQVLLQSGQYDAAAREYRALLWQYPSNRSYRLNLARALAWGERFAEAEQELRGLAAQPPRNTTVDSLLLSVRQALVPASYEATRWLAERPGSSEYRRMLARALAREGRIQEALAQYDTLVPRERTADLLRERAYVHVQQRHHIEAETDLSASIAMGPTVEALVMLGDVRRWRGELGSAHSLFSQARTLDPASDEVAAAFARLARDERPAAAFMPQAADGPGWQTTSSTASDNLGALFTSLALRRGFAMPRNLEGSAGVKVLRLSDQFVTGAGDVPPATAGPGSTGTAATGYGADVAFSGDATYRALYARARVRGGWVEHPGADLIPDAALTLSAWVRAWGAAFERATRPAYTSLVTMASFAPLPVSGMQLRERTTALSLAGPVRTLDVAGRRQRSAFSDGNTRTSLEALARFPLLTQVAVLYSGSSLSFAHSSPYYWDPVRYTVHAAGAEYAVRRWRGWSVAARLLPGIAWANERPAANPDSTVVSTSAQITAGAEASYRSDRWEMGTSLGYGRGRTGAYERYDVTIHVSYVP